MDSRTLSQQIEAMRRRVKNVYHASRHGAEQPDILAKILDELHYAVEQLHAAEEALRHNEQAIAAARDAQEQERQQTLDTFNHVPVPYVVTGTDGTIRRLNSAAARFLNQTEKALLGRSLGLFIPEGERRTFRAEIAELRSLAHQEERVLRFQPEGARPLDVACTIGAAHDRAGRVVALHWLLRDARASARHNPHARRSHETYVQAQEVEFP